MRKRSLKGTLGVVGRCSPHSRAGLIFASRNDWCGAQGSEWDRGPGTNIGNRKEPAPRRWRILAHPGFKARTDNSGSKVHPLPLFAIHKRVQELKREIADIRTASERYHRTPRHSTLEINKHLQRELRLQEILGELAMLTKKNAEQG